MRVFIKSVLLCSALLIGAVALHAETGNNFYDQWFQAKFGRPSPMAEARQKAEAWNAAPPLRVRTITEPVLVDNWHEQWVQAKFGRTVAK